MVTTVSRVTPTLDGQRPKSEGQWSCLSVGICVPVCGPGVRVSSLLSGADTLSRKRKIALGVVVASTVALVGWPVYADPPIDLEDILAELNAFAQDFRCPAPCP